MFYRMISAEIEPRQNEATRAAQALQRIGFRILHIGRAISVQAAPQLWESTFSISFRPQGKRVPAESGSEVSFLQAETDPIPIPQELQDVIASVAFVEPPELFGGPS